MAERTIDSPSSHGATSGSRSPVAAAGRFVGGPVRRFLFVAAVAFWLGGFTFYSGVVIHVGARVLRSEVRQGFVTQRVTGWLNVSAAVALPILLWNTAAVWRRRGPVARLVLAGTWLVIAAVQAELFVLHPVLDRLLDSRSMTLLDPGRFERLHFLYLTSSTVQWAAGVAHVWCSSYAEGG